MPAPPERRADRRAKPPRGKAAIGALPSGVRPATGALTAVAGGNGDGLRRLAHAPRLTHLHNLPVRRAVPIFPVVDISASMRAAPVWITGAGAQGGPPSAAEGESLHVQELPRLRAL